MKIRDSGMPDEAMWSTFFDPVYILTQLGLPPEGTVVDMGCGYGTFTIPSAQMTEGRVYAFDIESEMASICEQKAAAMNLKNILVINRDFIAEGTGLEEESVDFVMLFNILHTINPVKLLREAYRILRMRGKTGIIHWNYDPKTPRGPDLSIRPRPQQCVSWLKQVGFTVPGPIINLPPYHYGIIAAK